MRRRLLLVTVLAALAALLAAAPAQAGGSCHQERVTDATGTTVEMVGMCFSPTVLRVEPGQTVTWLNRDGVEHPVVGAGGTWALDSGMTPAPLKFDEPGIYPYFCHVHVGMVGVVVVGDGTASAQALAQVAPARPPAEAAPAATSAGSPGRTIVQALALAVLVVGGLAAFGVTRRRRRGAQPS